MDMFVVEQEDINTFIRLRSLDFILIKEVLRIHMFMDCRSQMGIRGIICGLMSMDGQNLIWGPVIVTFCMSMQWRLSWSKCSSQLCG